MPAAIKAKRINMSIFFLVSIFLAFLISFSLPPSVVSSDGGRVEDVSALSRLRLFHGRHQKNLSTVGAPHANESKAGDAIPRRVGMRLASVYYYVQVRVGKDASPQHLVFDTGSDLTWLQCEGCHPCFLQDLPKYNPDGSDFDPIKFNSGPLCPEGTGTYKRAVGDMCGYEINYMDGDKIIGELGKGIMCFEEDDGSACKATVSLAFGCTKQTNAGREGGVFFHGNKELTGMLGMSLGSQSAAQQLGNSIGHRFAHCLVPPESSDHSIVTFGDEAQIPDVGARTIRIQQGPRQKPPSLYYVKLLGISFGAERLRIPIGAFQVNGAAGVIIDSGTWYTYLGNEVYPAFKDYAIKYFSSYKKVDSKPITAEGGLCFQYGPRGRKRLPSFPKITFHFDGADMEVPGEHAFPMYPEHKAFCSIFIGDRGKMTTIGATQMLDKKVQYDLGAKLIKFADMDCAKTT